MLNRKTEEAEAFKKKKSEGALRHHLTLYNISLFMAWSIEFSKLLTLACRLLSQIYRRREVEDSMFKKVWKKIT